jgi:drug/metabolite transporter (DMT)-like permease
MQKNLKEIQVATKNRKEFFRYFIEYLSLIKNQLIGYSLLSVTIGLIAIYYMDFLTPYSLIAFLIVLITTLVNLVFGYMKYQVGTTKNGVIFFLAMIISIILIYFMQMTSYINYVSIALVFLFYTSFNHISVFILLSKKLKGEQ